MRKILTVFMTLLMAAPLTLSAEEVMTVHLKDGNQIDFAFKYQPVVTFTETDVVLATSNGLKINYPLANLTKFTFGSKDIPDEIVEIKEDARKVKFSVDEYIVRIDGAKTETDVRILASDGKVQGTYKTDKEGSLTFSIADLPEGIYVISSEDLNVKIQK